MDYRGRRALVMGLGVHGGGLGVARFLAERGAQVTMTDLRPAEQLAASLDALADLPITYVLGQHREDDFRSADLVVRNPAVPRHSPYLQVAAAAGVPVVMEMTLFFEECPSRNIIGITGTKGKTTTTLLLAAVLREHGWPHVVAGNLRRSALETLPRIEPRTWVVLELSSWQLEGLIPLQRSPHVAVITNIMPDHLDRYASYAEYARSKGLILRWQRPADYAVLNSASPPVRALVARLRGTDGGRGGAAPAGQSGETAGRVVWFDPASEAPGWETAHLYGAHNRANVAAAAAAARVLGIPATVIGRAVAAFPGVPHRLETVREFEGVRYINDTTATMPEALLAALGAMNRPTVLIAGGSDKGLDFSGVRAAVQGQRSMVTAVVLLAGTATPKIAAACGAKVVGAPGDLAAALATAREAAEPGSVVLLSPGCASFGMFANEFDRGDRFRELVQALT